MLTAGKTGSFTLNPKTGDLVLSREAYPIFGFDSYGDSPTCPMVVERIHPDDRDPVSENAAHAFLSGTSLEGEYRVLLPNGVMKHVHYVGHQVFRTTGGTSDYVGTLADVTSQKAFEAKLDATLSEARALTSKLILTVQRSEELTRGVIGARKSRAAKLVSESLAERNARTPSESPPGKMTPREREIIQLVAEARTTKQIALQLGIGAKTVEAHRTHLMKKLGLHSASELVRYAISNGIVEL